MLFSFHWWKWIMEFAGLFVVVILHHSRLNVVNGLVWKSFFHRREKHLKWKAHYMILTAYKWLLSSSPVINLACSLITELVVVNILIETKPIWYELNRSVYMMSIQCIINLAFRKEVILSDQVSDIFNLQFQNFLRDSSDPKMNIMGMLLEGKTQCRYKIA